MFSKYSTQAEGQMMEKNMYGYVRVSIREQNVERQLIALEKAGIHKKKIFIDRQS